MPTASSLFLMPEPALLRPGLLILSGNRLESLAEAVFAWLARHPLGALEEEIFLVQSNGMGEWLKMELAAAQGVCAATRVELPARLVWRAFREVLGRAEVPAGSALDKLPLTWRLMGLLLQLAGQPGFESVAAFLGGVASGDVLQEVGGGAEPARRLQLAQRLADLFDQYQVYRSDWLADWAEGRDVLRAHADQAPGRAVAVPADQRWQSALWRAALAGLSADERSAIRPALHRRFVQALAAGGAWPQLPRRIVLFGSTHIPHQTLEALAALSGHCQVLMAVPDPCRHHWADIIEGRELLRAPPRRPGARAGMDLAAVPMQDLHAHAHPLLAAWGRQARDFIRQLDAFDAAGASSGRTDVARVDLFDDAPGESLLQQVQARIRDLVPLAEHAGASAALPASDRSIVFHVAHSAQREVEILHDQLLHLFAHPPGGRPLNPRDVVVMVPQIDVFTPAIRSVFGQYPRTDARHIPWGIADRQQRGHHPLLVALEWLLRAPQQRFAFSEVRGLLDVPAIAARFGFAPDDLPTLVAWIEGAGIRWGLHAAQRASLDLANCGDANTWHFGLRRLLLGYATGDSTGHATAELADGFAGIEPYAEVGGLSAGLAGALAEMLRVLGGWWEDASRARTPETWGERLRALLRQMFAPTDDAERAVIVALGDALAAWLQACEAASFDAPIEIEVVREAWLGGVDTPGLASRFRAGGVTFCTLLPMRAIPFEVVCLLGMNDGDYPRRSPRSDFDLMASPALPDSLTLTRAGDRSRRDDDRQLMLDALLAARRVLYLSWSGRSPRDNQVQPPSVLVAQLRDYLAAGWGGDVLRDRTLEHPLQPFSRRYFEPRAEGAPDAGLITYAVEWRAAHVERLPPDAAPRPAGQAGCAVHEATHEATPLSLQRLARFLRNPVKEFFRHRLQVVFDEADAAAGDDEPFATRGLDRWQLLDQAIGGLRRRIDGDPVSHEDVDLAALVKAQVARLKRAGRLPMAGPGALVEAGLVGTLLPMAAQWLAIRRAHPQVHPALPLRLPHPGRPGLVLDDVLIGLRSGAGSLPVWIDLQAGRIADKKMEHPRVDKLLTAWVRCLASAAGGQPSAGVLIGADAIVRIEPLAPPEALATLHTLMLACHEGLHADQPFATAVLTGMAWLNDPDKARGVFDGNDHGAGRTRAGEKPAGRKGEGEDPCLARLYPDYATLQADPGFEPATRRLYLPYRDWLVAHVSVEPLPDHASVNGTGGTGGTGGIDSIDDDD